MDRRNGGDPLAPPRPPKLLPRVHRPRAPEPTIMSESNHNHSNNNNSNSSHNSNHNTSTNTSTSGTGTATGNTLQCINSTSSNNNNFIINTNINNLNSNSRATPTISTTTTTTNNLLRNNISNSSNSNSNSNNNSSTSSSNSISNNSNSNSSSSSSNNIIAIIPSAQNDLEDYQIHHLTFLPQLPSSLSRTGSHVSSNSTASTTSSSITAANSFTRRRPPPPRPGAAVPLLTISGTSSGSNHHTTNASGVGNNSNNSNSLLINNISGGGSSSNSSNSSNFFSHFQSAVSDATLLLSSATSPTTSATSPSLLSTSLNVAQAPASPVTLAQPRPESERLANEYVDTPLRNAQQQQQQQQQLQLQHATRAQHPAGQHDFGQTTTHHLLLLPQRELLQQSLQQQQHSSRVAGAAGTANITLAHGIDGTDGFLHSHPHHHHHQHLNNHQNHHHNHHHLLHDKLATATTTMPSSLATAATGKLIATTATGATTTASPTFGHLGSFGSTMPTSQLPITKQPTNNANNGQHHHQHHNNHHHHHHHGDSKFSKDLPALDNLLDLHNIATGISTPQGVVSAVDGASPLGTSILIGSMAIADGSGNPLTSITCPRCGGCRCEECQRPRPLPQTWVCNKTCLCSAESVIDYASCLCCAKALFYHCARDNDMDGDDGSGTPCVDNPCSCGPYKRTQRWGWLGALSLLLPCLWFYWPMRGCVAICEKCYGRYAVRGCRCQHIGSTSSMQPIVHMGVNGGLVGGVGGGIGGGQNGHNINVGNQNGNGKSLGHNECSTAASRILRKGNLTPEKRLLDSSPEY